ncbi:hypothetical protein HPC49_09320 [Pyxidicoccus fallax]|uniref:Uncharacterized protein n=1 Tax=Pyxidicoccus fallax TaxID=394095 RepID=A0A848L6Q8_9BACT|nr:hypothetical protein [Pyxidicoccus fallax]NMO14650.1 hypothetical protein [Pyxidicoccus fallax]NPC78441.1 hypothetical protein [Pyxidicoccus fallax]
MSAISKLSAGPSLASFRSIGSEMKAGEAGKLPGQETAENALKALSQNPILRSLLGESAFEGVKGAGKAEKAGAAGQAKPEEALSKILDTLKQLVSVLQTLAGQKPGEGAQGQQQAGGPQAPQQQAGGAEAPQGAGAPQQAGGPQAPQGAEAPQQAGGAQAPQGAGGVAEEEDEKDPLKKLLKALQQIVETLGKLMQSLGAQGGAGPGPGAGGAAPAAAA